LATVAVNGCEADGATVALSGDTLTVTGGGAAAWMVTVAEPTAEGLAMLAACTVTVDGFGIAAGAVYRPELEIVPVVAFPPLTPFTLQITPVFDEFSTVALNCRACVTGTPAADGDTVTVTAGAAVMVRLTMELVVPPNPLLTTVMGTFLPTWEASAIPAPFRPVADIRVVVMGTPPNWTVEFIPKFAPLREIVKAPTGTEVGEMLQSCTAGWVMVRATAPDLVG
jgi:hypothetical protein